MLKTTKHRLSPVQVLMLQEAMADCMQNKNIEIVEKALVYELYEQNKETFECEQFSPSNIKITDLQAFILWNHGNLHACLYDITKQANSFVSNLNFVKEMVFL